MRALIEGVIGEPAVLVGRSLGGKVAAYVAARTHVGTAERNRPAELVVPVGDRAECRDGELVDMPSYLAAFYARHEEPLRSQLELVVDAGYVADRVLDAITNDCFYIYTHPSWTAVMARRMDDIVQGRNPDVFV